MLFCQNRKNNFKNTDTSQNNDQTSSLTMVEEEGGISFLKQTNRLYLDGNNTEDRSVVGLIQNGSTYQKESRPSDISTPGKQFDMILQVEKIEGKITEI